MTALREGIGHLRDEAEQCRTAVCEALGRHMGLGWPTIVERVELAVAGASERAVSLEEARDALAAAGQNGAHSDDWPAIAPAIRALAAELKLRRGNGAVNRREAGNRREALAAALGLGRNAHWDAITARAGEVQAHLADYENRITWETNCGEHAWLLDALQTAETGRDEARQLAENMQGRATTLAAQVGELVDRLGEYADRGIANGERAEAAESTLAAVRTELDRVAALPVVTREDRADSFATGARWTLRLIRAALGGPQPDQAEPEPRVTSHTYEGDGGPCAADFYGQTCEEPRADHELVPPAEPDPEPDAISAAADQLLNAAAAITDAATAIRATGGHR